MSVVGLTNIIQKIRKIFIYGLVLVCSSSFGVRAEENDIQVTLIFPETVVHLPQQESTFEGLVSDLSVKQIRLLVNDQPLRFVDVNRGFFEDRVVLDRRENRIEISGANQGRKYFQTVFAIENTALPERSAEEKIPPMVEVAGLDEQTVNILSPVKANALPVKIWDNRGLAQASWYLDGMKPTYFEAPKGLYVLKIPPFSGQSTRLYVEALDKDGNRTSKSWHIRVEHLNCELKMAPKVGIFNRTPAMVSARVDGGVPPLSREYRLLDKTGQVYASRVSSEDTVILNPVTDTLMATLQAELTVTDANGIEALCRAPGLSEWFSASHPEQFEILEARLDSQEQKFRFRIVPPIREGVITVMLKKDDPVSGVTGQAWKVLGDVELKSTEFRTIWEESISRRVPTGDYLMKLGYVLGTRSQMRFTGTTDTSVSQSELNERDLLQDILREELGN